MIKKQRVNVLILSFIFSPNVGGVETHLDELCEYLLSKKHNLTVITYKPIIGTINAPFFQKKKKIVIYRIPWIRWNLFNKLINHPLLQIAYLTPGIFIASCLHLILENKKTNIIQAHGFNMAIVAFLLFLLFDIPFTVNTHVSFSFNKNLYSSILSFILNKAAKVLVLTDVSKQELVKIGVDESKIVTYHYWVDNFFRPFEKNKMRKSLGIPLNRFTVLFVGRFIKEKGVITLINVFKKISNVNLIMIGSGPLNDIMHDSAKKSSNIKIVNTVNRSDLPKWYSAADITIIPSTKASSIYSEGIPRVMIESLSCATPVVATRTGGLESTLSSNVGFFIESDTSQIKKFLTMISGRKETIKKLSRNCTDYVSQNFDMKRNAQKIEESLLS